MNVRGDLRTIHVVASNIGRRYSGVTTSIRSVVPHQAPILPIATYGARPLPGVPGIGLWQLLRHGWSPLPGKQFRIWHGRRNIDLITGIFLRDVLRQPWKLVFTSAAQRDHSRYTKWLIRRMDAVIAASPEAERHLEVPSMVIPHGVDIRLFHPADDRAAAWAETGLPGKYGIGALGRVRPQKGTDLFVEAMCRLLPEHPEFTAVVIGLATKRHQPYLRQLRIRIARAGLQHRILILGELPPRDIPAWFRRLTIHAAPQRQEGFGLTPLEAMASGTAVVATRAGAFESQILHGQTGLLVNADSADELTSAIGELMADPAHTEHMGRAGREHVEAKFSVEHEARAICEVYDWLWAGAPRLVPARAEADSHSEFRFRPEDLKIGERKPGISAFMRIRNGADFLEATIRSHISHFDEIVAVHNRCTDETPDILARLAQEFGPKLKVHHYLPEVFPQGSTGHRTEPAGSPRSVVNYSNYALARTSHQVVVKLDDDHLAIEPAVARTVQKIRAGELRPGELLCFSGFNLMQDGQGRLGIRYAEPFSGSGDIGFFHISPTTYFVHDPRFETFQRKGLERRFADFLYWHLKYMKREHGFGNYDFKDNPKSRYLKKRAEFIADRTIYAMDEKVLIGGAQGQALARIVTAMPVPEKLRLVADRLLGADKAFGGKPPVELLRRSAPHADEFLHGIVGG